MKDILEEIVAHKRIEVAAQKAIISPATLQSQVERLMSGSPAAHISMKNHLQQSQTGIIAEFKRKSPSKGWIKEDGKPEIIPLSYQENGASALSILTDKNYFGGSLDFIATARPLLSLPILRKDFIIDEYQLFEARLVGANAVLLIAADLPKPDCKHLAALAHQLGLEILLEIHSESELDYADIDVDMIGVNNRNLGTFHTDVQNSFDLADKLPDNCLHVSESGISNPDTIKHLRQVGYRGFLMGEQFMKAANPGDALSEFINKLNN